MSSGGDDGQRKDEQEVKDQDTPKDSSQCGKESPIDEYELWSSSEGRSSTEDELDTTVKSLVDFSSPKFNPVLALKCQAAESVPVAEGAKMYLNIQQFSKAVTKFDNSPRKDVAALKKITLADIQKKTSKEEGATAKPSASTSSATSEFPIPGRRFLPHQLPVFRPRKEHPNTLTLMETVDGPLSVLKRVMIEKCRVKIWTRNDRGFRGYLTGFVEAFDKHWNIALRDVDEQFVRRRVVKFPIMGDAIQTESDKILDEMSEPMGIDNKTGDDNDDFKKKEQAISSAFMRLKNYLRLNEGKKRVGSGSASNNNLRSSKRRNSGSVTASAVTTKSKTIYVGDMDPLNICRTGLERLSLCDDIHQAGKDPSLTPKRRFSTRTKRSSGERPDIIECHQRRLASAEPSSSSSSSTSSAAARSVPTIQLQFQGKPSITRTSLKKKSLTVFKTPYEDSFGFMVVAHTKKYELVERHVGQVLLMGNDIVFIETSGVDKL